MRLLPVLALLPVAASAFEADLRRDPSKASFSVQGADDGRFEWIRGEGVAASLDSTQPGSRLVAPLGFSLDGTTSFVAEADLVLSSVQASPDDFFQIAVGLVSLGSTGLNRTGTALPGPPFFVDDSDTHDSVEIAYFANLTAFGGPFLQPTVFGAPRGSAFANFAANFGPSSDLGDNGPGEIRELPQDVPLRLSVRYDACAQALTTRVFDLSGREPAELATGVQPLDLSVLNASGTFTVDAVALSAYEDLADFDRSTPSLRADVLLQRLGVERLPEPSAKVVPHALNPRAAGPARLRLEGVAEGTPITVVLSGGAAVSVPLGVVVHGTVAIDRALVEEPLALDAAGCVLSVDVPVIVPR